MYCPKCGTYNEEGANFCEACGANLRGLGETPTKEDVPPAGGGGWESPSETREPVSRPPKYQVNMGKWLGDGINEAFGDFGNYFLLGLIVMLVSGITFGLLGLALIPGSIVVIRRKLRGQGRIDIGEVFNEGFKYFGQFFLLALVWALILLIPGLIFLGCYVVIAAYLPFLALPLMWVEGVFSVWYCVCVHFITEERADFWTASTRAWNFVGQQALLLGIFGFIASFLSGLGTFACLIGIFFTQAMEWAIMAVMLEDLFPQKVPASGSQT